MTSKDDPVARERELRCIRCKLITAVIAATLWNSAATCAEDPSSPGALIFTFNGFGTLGGVHSSEGQADFVSNPYQPKGAGFTSQWSASPDSKVGIQVNAQFTDRLSAIVQVVSQYQYNGTFTPDLEWGNVKYQFTPDFDVRAGRIAIPTYMESDSLNIGYTLPFIRIPLEIYSQLPATHSDGLDTSYRFHVGTVTNTVQAFVGGFDSKLPDDGVYNIRNQKGVVDTIEYGATTVHLSYQTVRYDLNFAGVVLNNDPQNIVTLGINYDPGSWYASGEWIRAPDPALGLYYCWYVTAGYRVNRFTPYIGYARAYLAHPGATGFGALIDQDTTTLGARWDFMKNVDLKLQIDRTALHGGIDEFFVDQQPNFKANGTVHIVSLAVDFVF